MTIKSSETLLKQKFPCWSNVDRNCYIFIQENAFENVVWTMAAIVSGPECV